MSQFATLDSLTAELNEMGNHSAEYWDKQVHVVPKSQTVDRFEYLVSLCKDKTILHIGCTGRLDEVLMKAAKRCYGTDKQLLERNDFTQCDLDVDSLPKFEGIELVVCGEVLEHLSNPGLFLAGLKATYAAPVVFTVPNAFCTSGAEWLLKRGRENVNNDHVCYYSYTTIKELLRRVGYGIHKHYWYGGKPYISEGLIILARA